jgi:hypothetical protein
MRKKIGYLKLNMFPRIVAFPSIKPLLIILATLTIAPSSCNVPQFAIEMLPVTVRVPAGQITVLGKYTCN